MNHEDKHIGKQLQGMREINLGDGTTYKVFFSFNAMIDLIDKYGSLKIIFAEFEKGDEMNMKVFLDFLYHGIREKNKEVTIEELGANLDFFNMGEYVKQVFGGMKDNLPTNTNDLRK